MVYAAKRHDGKDDKTLTKLDKLVEIIERKSVYIQTHNYPDPDALASAKGLQTILKSRGIESKICYKGYVDKYNTVKMMEYLGIQIVPGDMLHFQETDQIILVDCQKGNTNVKDFPGDEIGCIDHHKLQDTDGYRFFDIRSHVGACSSIIASYFLENHVPMDAEMATTLLYGIKVDTNNLTRGAGNLDVDVFSYLYKMADHEVLRALDSNALKRSDLDSYARAIKNLKIQDDVGITNIGNECSEAMIGALSDFILTLSEVHFSIVYSYRAGGLKFSVRSDTPVYDAAQIVKKALEGYGDGGGHAALAAGFVPNLTQSDAKALLPLLEERFLEQIRAYTLHMQRAARFYTARTYAK